MSTNNVPKKQSNIRISRYYKRNDLALSFDKSGDVVLETFIVFVLVQKKKLVVNEGER